MINGEILSYVCENSNHVTIDIDNMNAFVDNIKDFSYEYWLNSINVFKTEEEKIVFAFICESINFCFWGNKFWTVKYEEHECHGSEAMFYSLIAAIKTGRLSLDITSLSSLTFDDFKDILLSNGELPLLLRERFRLFSETVHFINENKNNFFETIFSMKTDQELLHYIVENIKHFDDSSLFDGKIIHFNKRATLLVNDLFNLSETVRRNIKNVNGLFGGADYSIPRLFFANGILKYSSELSDKIFKQEMIAHNSQMEIEIRANTLYVLELMKKRLRERHIYINSIELDNIIWKMRNNVSIPAHHTECIYY